MAKEIKIIRADVTNKEDIYKTESQLEKLINDGWVIVGQCAYGDSLNYFWVILQKG
jgi:hypothetical protein